MSANPTKRARLSGDETTAQILAAAVKVAKRHGLTAITKQSVAAEAGVSPSLVLHYFERMAELRSKVIAHAVKHNADAGMAGIVAEGLALRHPVARRAPAHVKRLATAAWSS